MPYSEKQRKFFFTEINRRKKGVRRKMKGITTKKLTKLARSPLDREINRG